MHHDKIIKEAELINTNNIATAIHRKNMPIIHSLKYCALIKGSCDPSLHATLKITNLLPLYCRFTEWGSCGQFWQ